MLRSRSRQKGLDSCTRNHVDKRVRHEISAEGQRIVNGATKRGRSLNEAIGKGLFT